MVKIEIPAFEVWDVTKDPVCLDGTGALQLVERCGKLSHKTEGAITPESWREFIPKLLGWRHKSVFYHAHVTIWLRCNRGWGNELVRNHVGFDPTQESTRYCCYADDKFGSEVTVIDPYNMSVFEACVGQSLGGVGLSWYGEDATTPEARKAQAWWGAMAEAERAYFEMVKCGAVPDEARGVLPLDLKTEIVETGNLWAWHHVLKERTSAAAHPDMRRVMIPVLTWFNAVFPAVFGDIVHGPLVKPWQFAIDLAADHAQQVAALQAKVARTRDKYEAQLALLQELNAQGS